MDMVWDLNHVIKLNLTLHQTTTSYDKTIQVNLVPSTAMSDLILMDEICEMCYSQHGIKMQHLEGGSPLTDKSFDFFYMLQMYHVQVKGEYYQEKVCFTAESCETAEIPIFVVEQADPYFTCLGDGYFGLAPTSS